MEKKVFYLKTCDTCMRILKRLEPQLSGFEKREIKSTAITPAELEEMYKLAGSYEMLFSKRSQQYKVLGLAQKTLSESDFRQLILSQYSFLKRPVFIFGENLFAGNDKNTVSKLEEALAQLSD